MKTFISVFESGSSKYDIFLLTSAYVNPSFFNLVNLAKLINTELMS